MPHYDILLQMDSYPEPTPPEAIGQAATFAAMVGGVLSGLAVEIDIRAPSNRLAGYVIGLGHLAEEEEQKSRRACETLLETFSSKAQAAGVRGEVLRARADLYSIGDLVAERARTRDLTIVPVTDQHVGQDSVAAAVVFGSGRPVLLFRPGARKGLGGALNSVVLAWDASRSAARAMGDALPIMRKARDVRVVIVTNEKPDVRSGQGKDALRHLVSHGVKAVVDEVDAGGRRIGEVLDDYVAEHRSDLLVMGAYGRSRVRDFILGGATEYMLHEPKSPLLLSY